MKVSKWGNSLAIRLTNDIVDCLQVVEGDEVVVRVTANLDGVTLRKKLGRDELRKRVRAMRGLRPAGFRFSREELNEG